MIALLVALTEVFASIHGHSNALLTDAVHLLLDSLGFMVALVIVYFEGRRVRHGDLHPSGAARICIASLLILSAGWLIFEAIDRLIREPDHVVHFAPVLAATALGISGCGFQYLLSRQCRCNVHHSLREHIRIDFLLSVGALFGLGLAATFDSAALDSITTIGLSLVVGYAGLHLWRGY